MVTIEGTFYRIVYYEKEGIIEVEFEPWELTSVPKEPVSKEYYQGVVEKLSRKGFTLERKGNNFMFKGSFGSGAENVFEEVKEVLEEYETKNMLKKTVC